MLSRFCSLESTRTIGWAGGWLESFFSCWRVACALLPVFLWKAHEPKIDQPYGTTTDDSRLRLTQVKVKDPWSSRVKKRKKCKGTSAHRRSRIAVILIVDFRLSRFQADTQAERDSTTIGCGHHPTHCEYNHHHVSNNIEE